MNNKLKVFISLIIVLVLIATGTLAWVNMSQNIANEFQGTPNNGGSTHDDFDNPNKDVYVENWGESILFVRIRLDEFMQIGTGAGLKGQLLGDGTWEHNPANKAVSLVPTANIDDKATWTPHIPDGNAEICDIAFHKYWSWDMGGWKYYMPAPADKRTDANYVDQDNAIFDASTPGVSRTLDSTGKVITMEEWISLGSPIGPYWVIDTDGWAYWAAPLNPGEATGLLLNAVNLISKPSDSYYYAINVLVQMATKDGDENYKDFYNGFDSDHNATNNGKDLLDIITGNKVQEIKAASISINGGDQSLTVGQIYTPGYAIDPTDSTDKPVWSSDNTAVATVDPNTGKITAVAPGTATITVTAGGKTDSIVVTVSAAAIPATSVSINGGDQSLTVGQVYTPGYAIDPTNSTDVPQWTSDNTAVATVDPNTGKITAVAPGTATITVTAGGKTDSIVVTVSAAAIPATSVSINDGDKTLNVNETASLTASVTPTNSTDVPQWTSDNPSVATVDPNTGLITAVAPGIAHITAKAGSITSAPITVTVNQPSNDITLSATSVTLNAGESQTITYTLAPSNSTDSVTWTSNNTAFATVTPGTTTSSKSVTITGAAQGTTTITVTTSSGVTKTINVTVHASTGPMIETLSVAGPYDNPAHSYDSALIDQNDAMMVDFEQGIVYPGLKDQPGSIPLSMILKPGTDTTGLGVIAAVDPANNNKYFTIGTDKHGNPAILYSYLPTTAEILAALPGTPVITVNLYLTQTGHTDTPITIVMHYDGSLLVP